MTVLLDVSLRSGYLGAVTDRGRAITILDFSTAQLTNDDCKKLTSATLKKNASINKLARSAGIPRSTLRGRMKTVDFRRTVRSAYLRAYIEQKINTRLLQRRYVSYSFSHAHVGELLWLSCEEAGSEGVIQNEK
jgi:hypothetical protein